MYKSNTKKGRIKVHKLKKKKMLKLEEIFTRKPKKCA